MLCDLRVLKRFTPATQEKKHIFPKKNQGFCRMSRSGHFSLHRFAWRKPGREGIRPGEPATAVGVIKSGCGLSSWKWGQECPQNPQAGKPALRVAQTFLSAGSGDFPVACPSPTFNHTRAIQSGGRSRCRSVTTSRIYVVVLWRTDLEHYSPMW